MGFRRNSVFHEEIKKKDSFEFKSSYDISSSKNKSLDRGQ